jgi:AraC-like DNA-binding protein
MAKNIQDQSGADKIKAAAEFIKTYYDQPIKISDIAYEVNLSAGRLCHLFKEQMGVTPIAYLNNIRIEQAMKLLLTTDKKCCNLYYEVGYNSQAYFVRRFKEIAGMSPAQFRASKSNPKC